MTEKTGENLFGNIVQDAMAVITRPAEFYRGMARKGGFVPPLVFMVVMAAAAGLVRALMAMIGMGHAGMGLAAVIMVPLLAAIFGFVGAAVVFVIWKIIGSGEDYETAYRCLAYSCAISPLTALVDQVPYVGLIVPAAWGTWLIVCASVEVHGIAARKAWLVFGAIAALMVLSGLAAEHAGRVAMRQMGGLDESMRKMQQQMDSGEIDPEEAGRMMGQFLKGLEKSVGENR